MESRSRVIDTFQIVGFAVSTAVAIVLLVADVDPVQSTAIGLMLAILTELFDLQLRQSAAEERVLQANALSQALYRDPELLSKFRQMVEDYYSIQSGWFDLFKLRAADVLGECHSILRSMAMGMMQPPLRSQFMLSYTGFKYAKSNAKQVSDWAALRGTVDGVRDWYMNSMAEAVARGVQMMNVVILSRKDLEDALAQMEHTDSAPGGTYVALADELPADLDENYMILDDRVVSLRERNADGSFGKETISIIPVEVERMVKRFDQVMRYARTWGDVVARAKNKGATEDEQPTATVQSGDRRRRAEPPGGFE
jgi:hypothetical protein